MFGQSDRRGRAMLYGNKPDDKRYMEMREARQQYLAYTREIERLEYKLNNKIEVYEKRENLEEQFGRSKVGRDTLELTFDERFGVQGYEGLAKELKRLDLERYGIPDRTKERQGSQGGQEVPVPKKEDREVVERNMKDEADMKNHGLVQTEEQEALQCSQEASSQIGYSKQRLDEEMKRGGKDHDNKNHGDALHPEIKKVFSGESGEGRRLTLREQLERLKREHDEAIEKKRDHDRDR